MSALVDSTRPTCLSSSRQPTSGRPSQSYVTTGRAGLYAGLSRNSIKALLASGELVGRKTKGGHWRIKTSSLVCWVEGVEEEEIEVGGGGGVVVYVRVSSEKQKESLARQRERLVSEAASREGISKEEIIVYQEVASSFGRRIQLNRLVDALLCFSVRRLYIEFYDRFSRTGSERALLQHLAATHNCEIIPLDMESKDPSDQSYLAEELIAYVTVVCNRVSAAKSRKVTFKELSDETIRTLFCWMGEGLGLTAIYRRATEEGLRTEAKGDKPGEPLSYYKIRDLLHNGKGKLVGTIVGMDATSPTEILQTWLEENLVESEDSQARVFADEVLGAYQAHCGEIGIEPLYPNIVGKEVSKIWEGRRYKTSRTGQTGIQAYRGLALREKES